MIQGVIFVVIVMAFRKGLVGELGEWWKRRAAPKAEPGAGATDPPCCTEVTEP